MFIEPRSPSSKASREATSSLLARLQNNNQARAAINISSLRDFGTFAPGTYLVFKSLMISRLAFIPGAPVTPPPG